MGTLRSRGGRVRGRLGHSGSRLAATRGTVAMGVESVGVLIGRVRGERQCVSAVRLRLLRVGHRIVGLRRRITDITGRLGGGGRSCTGTLHCTEIGRARADPVLFILSSQAITRLFHHSHCTERCTGCRHALTRRVIMGRSSLVRGGGSLLGIGTGGGCLLRRYRQRGTRLRGRRRRRRGGITKLQRGHGILRGRIRRRRRRLTTLRRGVSRTVTCRIRRTHLQTRTTEGGTRRRTGQGTGRATTRAVGGRTRAPRRSSVPSRCE